LSAIPLFHPAAIEELESSVELYEARQKGLGLDLNSEVGRAVDAVLQSPQCWPIHAHGTRKYLLRRFPFNLIYLELPDAVWIVAIAHCSRKPDYWKLRLKNSP